MFRVGDRVECSLTGILCRAALWDSYYPGTILSVYEGNPNIYQVKLDKYDTLNLSKNRIYKKRTDRIRRTPVKHEDVHVLEYDGEVPVWCEAIIIDPTIKNGKFIRIQWKGRWSHENTEDMVKLNNVRPAQEEQEPEKAEPIICPQCLEEIPNGKTTFYETEECASCFVESRVDSILDQMESYEEEYGLESFGETSFQKWKVYVLKKRLFILQTGGSTPRRDERLFKQLKRGLEKMQEMLLEEHPDEEEWDPLSEGDVDFKKQKV